MKMKQTQAGNRFNLMMLSVLLLLLLGCAPAEEAPPQADGDVTDVVVTETAVSPTPIPPTPTPQPPTPTPEPDLTALADAWEAAFNAGDVEALLDLYAEDARWSQTDMAAVEGKEALVAQLAFDLGLQGEMLLSDCVADETSVTCGAEWTHGWQTAVSLPTFIFNNISWTIADDLIVQEDRTLAPELAAAIDELWAAFMPWGKAHHPGDMRKLFTRDEGVMIPSAENAPLLVELLTEWQAAEQIVSIDALLGVWSLFTPDIDMMMQFLEDGTGRVAKKRSAFSNEFDPEDEASGYLFEYWFEGAVLFIKQTTPGNLKQGVGCNVEKEEVGQYIVDRAAEHDGIRFWVVDDRCSGRIYGLANNWWEWLE